MLRKSFGDDFDAKGSVPQIAFTKDYKVRTDTFTEKAVIVDE